MRAFEFLIESANLAEYGRPFKYRDGGKPDWYNEAVQLKTDNDRMTAKEIGSRLNSPISATTVLRWLAGIPDFQGKIYNDNPPFTSKDFPRVGNQKYFDGDKPVWYDEAVQLKTDNDRMSATEIGSRLKIHPQAVLRWLVGLPDFRGRIYNTNPPFTSKDFPKMRTAGGKPDWYEEAVRLRHKGMTWQAIADKLSTSKKRFGGENVRSWLVKGRKYKNGELINLDAPFEPRPINKKIDPALLDLLKPLIDKGYTDEEIIELVASKLGNERAIEVRDILASNIIPRVKPKPLVIDKTRTGLGDQPNITI